jgi:hypothetical protein
MFETSIFPIICKCYVLFHCYILSLGDFSSHCDCFGGPEALCYNLFSSAIPQKTAYSEVPSQIAANVRTGSPLYAGFEPGTAGLQ